MTRCSATGSVRPPFALRAIFLAVAAIMSGTGLKPLEPMPAMLALGALPFAIDAISSRIACSSASCVACSSLALTASASAAFRRSWSALVASMSLSNFSRSAASLAISSCIFELSSAEDVTSALRCCSSAASISSRCLSCSCRCFSRSACSLPACSLASSRALSIAVIWAASSSLTASISLARSSASRWIRSSWVWVSASTLASFSCMLFCTSSICCSSPSSAFFSFCILALSFIRVTMACRLAFSIASAFCAGSIPANCASSSTGAPLFFCMVPMSLFFSSMALRNSSICSVASRRSSCSASLFWPMCCATMKSGTSPPSTLLRTSSCFLRSCISASSALISCICSLTTLFISACSFSTVPWSGRTVMLRHAWPKRIDAVPISTCSLLLLSARMTWSMLLPPRPFCRIMVSLLSRKGMFFVPSARHLTTSASFVRERLTLRPSLMAPRPFLRPSEPARSTSERPAARLPLASTHVTLKRTRPCERAWLVLEARAAQPAA
mmetsp:Transcript_59262/g.142156  ORF Transcript_59262/g.142156 Transcript_59262/m.142156 type:complete len:500 (+) Transcript_59262:2716-4215(+)